MKAIFTLIFSILFSFVFAQEVVTMKVEKPKERVAATKVIEGGAAIQEPFRMVDQMPVYPGGENAIAEYIQKNINQKLAIDLNISGTSYVTFVVDTSGQVMNVRTTIGLQRDLDAEAIRVVSSLGRFAPGRNNGILCPVNYTIPVRFKVP